MSRLLTALCTLLLLAACGAPKAAVSKSAAAPGGTASEQERPRLPYATSPDSWALADTVITVTNLEEAQAIASATEKSILMVFAGSDWCAPCKVFKRSVLEDATWLEGGKDDYVVVYLDFPSKKRNQLPADQKAYNDALAEAYNPQGVFPRIYLLDAGGETIAEMKFGGQSAEEFVAELTAARS